MSEGEPVLCVEDNDANYALIARVLESTGRWKVQRAKGVDEARVALRRARPVVILLDLDLPGAPGLELAKELRSEDSWGDVPIVVVSASVMKREHHEARAAGCDDFVEKPFDIAELRRVVARAVDRRR